MIVVAIIALLAAIAVPGFLRARKRSKASKILNDLRMIDSAVDQYAVETNRKTGDTVAIADWTNYLKKGLATVCWAALTALKPSTQFPKCRPPITPCSRMWPAPVFGRPTDHNRNF